MSETDAAKRILALEARVSELEQQLRKAGQQRQLSEHEQRLRLAHAVIGLGLWCWDLRSQELIWDANMCKLHGVESAPLRGDAYIETFVPAEDRERMRRDTLGSLCSDGQLPPQIMHRIVRGDGTVRWVLTTAKVQYEDGQPTWAIGGCLDATRQHELEEQVHLSQSMEAVGTLTAGVAHNFNNMLAVILPTLELAAELVPPERVELLRQASQAAGRASELVRQLMTYAGQSRISRHQPCNIAGIAQHAMVVARRDLESHVALTLDIEPELREAEVEGNPLQLKQVLVSLMQNARDAIVEAGRLQGQVSVRVRRSPVPLRSKQHAEPRAAVCIDVVDNGTGVSAEVRPRLFEPFFTTKSRSQGTGLGLATSYGVMRDHGGTLECQPSPEVGAAFTLTLPLLAVQTPTREPPAFASEELPAGTSVLLIDDDASVRGALGHVLHSLGLTVFEAACGPTALGALRAHPDVEIVLLDLSKSSEPDAFVARLKDIAPRARVLLLSGDAVEGKNSRLADAVVSKPVSSPLLIKTIRSVLEETKP